MATAAEKKQAKATGEKLKRLAQGVVEDIRRGSNPGVAIPVRSLANVSFDPKKKIIRLDGSKQRRSFFNLGQAKKFMQTFLVASACKELLDEGKHTSIRDLYYMTKHTIGDTRQNTFDEQEESDPIIEDLEVTVDALREELNLFASNRGAMVGPMTVVDSGDTIDLRRMGSGGWSIPSIVEAGTVQFKKSEAKFILLVEKDAVWRRLNEDRFWKKHGCMLLHSQGMASRGVRRIVHRMSRELKIPLYVVVDNDPWGFYIYSVIKQGSINRAYESMRMAVPDARFLGISSTDAKRYGLPANVSIRLDDRDIRRAKQMLEYPWFQRKEWQAEIETMLKSGVKYEIEALSAKGISFVTEEYLPRKIRDGDWLAG
jgi:DNA topoisomerase VI subunit A